MGSPTTTGSSDRIEHSGDLDWLEDLDSVRVGQWVAEQNQVSVAALDSLPERAWFLDRLTTSGRGPRHGVPMWAGQLYVRTSNTGEREQDVLLVGSTPSELRDGDGRVLIDPQEFDAAGLTAIGDGAPWRHAVASLSMSPDGRFLAYGIARSGSDWVEWRVREVASGKDTGDSVTRTKFCLAEWLGDSSGFLYCGFPEDGRDVPPGGLLMKHTLGTGQDHDVVLPIGSDDPDVRTAVMVTPDHAWLVVDSRLGMSEQNDLTVHPLSPDGQIGVGRALVADRASTYAPVGYEQCTLYLRTDHHDGQGTVVAFDLNDETAQRPRVVVPAGDLVLTEAIRVHDGILAVYLVPNGHRLVYHPHADDAPVVLDVDDLCSIEGVAGRPGDPEVFIGVNSYTRPLRTLRLDLEGGTVEEFDTRLSAGPDVVHERATAVSADGTEVPYVLVRAASTPSDHPRSTLVYGYGGFGYATLPRFSPVWPTWLEAGGVLAVPSLRGGNEYGQRWHSEGRGHLKQNVFNDCIAVIEKLHASGVCTPTSTALYGRSNGGLLVGAVLTQRPDLLAAAVPAVGVLDMLRYHTMSVGWMWVSEYGDPDDPQDLEVLLRYSPVHNISADAQYPPTLVLTGDHDDRVVPAHSYKFVARMQEASPHGGSPVLLRVETDAGHGAGKPRHLMNREAADILAFAAHHTGVEIP